MIHKNCERADNILWQHKFSKKLNTKNIKQENSLSVFSALCSIFFSFLAHSPISHHDAFNINTHTHTHSPPNVFQLFAKPKHLTVFLSHFLLPKMIYALKRKLCARFLFLPRVIEMSTKEKRDNPRKPREWEQKKLEERIRIEYLFDEYARSIEKQRYSGCGFSLLFF